MLYFDQTSYRMASTEFTRLSPDMMDSSIATYRRRSTVSYFPYSQRSQTSSSPSPELATESVVTQSDDDDSQISPGASSDGVTTQPKIEEMDDDILRVYDLDEAKPVLFELSSAPPAPRKRGRPRKNLKTLPNPPKKATHARSKTGCGTCRRRKKKCDEEKPHCSNCKKNNVVCDGYEPLQPWQSGRQRGLTGAWPPIRLPAGPPAELPLLVGGVEGPVDMMFLEHFTSQLGNVLSLTDSYNPFQDIIIPMAMQNVGLMHSVLYLSGSCLTAHEPRMEWEERQAHHNDKAIILLRESLEPSSTLDIYDRSTFPNGDPSIAHTLVLFLQTVCAGAIHGEYRLHLDAMKSMLTEAKLSFPNEQLRLFLLEFVLYHDYCASITNLVNPIDNRSKDLMELKLPQYMIPPAAGALLGVFDGMFCLISRIRCLRDKIREQRAAGHNLYDASIWREAFAIDCDLRDWNCTYTEDNPRYACSLLYRQCTWIYLYRTVQPSKASDIFEKAVDQGLYYLSLLPMGASEGSMQSVLLMPLFLLGCAAFEPRQRHPISMAFDQLEEWSGLANIKYARVIVKDIWKMMDDGLESKTWDWESIIASNGWDFLIT